MGNNIEQHKNILDGIHKTYIAKNNDYGNSFSKSFDKYGITCAMVRMEDKWNRLESLVSGKKQMVADESIKDTCLDLANYLVMTVMELENRDVDKKYKKAYEELEIRQKPIFKAGKYIPSQLTQTVIPK